MCGYVIERLWLTDGGWLNWLKGGEGDGTKASILGTPESLIYAGLKFTGLAARIAGDLAKSIKNDAEKLMFEVNTENSQKVSPKHSYLPTAVSH